MKQLDGDDSIVQLYNIFEDIGFKYLIMEVCKGGDLFKAMLLRGGKMDEHWTCNEVKCFVFFTTFCSTILSRFWLQNLNRRVCGFSESFLFHIVYFAASHRLCKMHSNFYQGASSDAVYMRLSCLSNIVI